MRVSAKVDYAVRAAVERAVAGEEPLTAEVVAQRQQIPVQFLQKIFHSFVVLAWSPASAAPKAGIALRGRRAR